MRSSGSVNRGRRGWSVFILSDPCSVGTRPSVENRKTNLNHQPGTTRLPKHWNQAVARDSDLDDLSERCGNVMIYGIMRQHEIPIRVRYSETDAMGFLQHANYFSHFEVGRTELFRAQGGLPSHGRRWSVSRRREARLPIPRTGSVRRSADAADNNHRRNRGEA